MTIEVARRQTENYLVETALFNGPLDLLLHLIERAELDITRLALAEVTNQYLIHLRQLIEQDAGEVSAFLIIAARLLQIKSEALLPHHSVDTADEPDPGELLAQQLIRYRLFKRASEWLEQREKAGLRTFLRLSSPPHVASKLDLAGITLTDLIFAAHTFYQGHEEMPLINSVINIPRTTIRNRIQAIMSILRDEKQSSLSKLLGMHYTRIDMIITFLAILELVKRNIVAVRQEELFADIHLNPLEGWSVGEDFEIEF
jgi:segregation and condensation protein A